MIVGNGDLLPIHSSSQGLLHIPNMSLILNALLHVSSISHNLIFIQKLPLNNYYSINFDSFGFSIKDRKINSLTFNHRFYQNSTSRTTLTICFTTTSVPSLWNWCLDHPSSSIQSKLHLSPPSLAMYRYSCFVSKSHRIPFSITKFTAYVPL